MRAKGCGVCRRPLPWGRGEWVGNKELCPRCAIRARREYSRERERLEEEGQGVMLADEVPFVVPALGGLFEETA